MSVGETKDEAGGLRIGFHAPADLERVTALEALSIDSLWVGGHVASPNPTSEAMTSLARLSAVTRRVTIGTSILLLPLYTPTIVAKQVAELDRATGGRVVLGVGIGGEYPAEFSACQVPLRERGRRTNEAIGLLRRLWTGEPVTHDGPFYPMENVRIHPAPARPGGPPIVVAGRQEAAMRRAALLGDGWMPYLYSPRRYAASVATIRELAADAGRDLTGFDWYAFVFVNVDPDGDAAREGAARMLGGTYRQDFRAMVDSVAAAGTPAEVTAKLRAFVDAGARHFIFLPAPGPDGDPDPVIQRLLADIVPSLRDYARATRT
ncbi:LLM class flavin-dependent oxidoreductase [Frankia nepalensis]|uniref:LLM class flavin-dependent oxidoreductase n=1 Tax=Frankia nepalensis TaxID=1836974 RepID=UPI0027DBF8ED|nr:LLM class flavin-dependent oxidoreductase [Frankia nepalensis]